MLSITATTNITSSSTTGIAPIDWLSFDLVSGQNRCYVVGQRQRACSALVTGSNSKSGESERYWSRGHTSKIN